LLWLMLSLCVLLGAQLHWQGSSVGGLSAEPCIIQWLWRLTIAVADAFCLMLLLAGMVMFASAICVRAGAASQAAFEIIRQVSADTEVE
jgi:hypothetical protein